MNTMRAYQHTLRTPQDWMNWLAEKKILCLRNGIWQHVNPNTIAEPLDEPMRPDQGVEANTRMYQDFKLDYAIVEKKKEAMRVLYEDIVSTVDHHEIKRLILKYDNAKDLLLALKKSFAPTAIVRQKDLKQQYLDLARRPAKSQSREDWIEEWKDVVTDAIDGKAIDTLQAKQDFILVNMELDRVTTKMLVQEARKEDWSFKQLADEFIEEYRDDEAYECAKSRNAMPFATAQPTLNGETAGLSGLTNSSSSSNKKGSSKYANKECLCQEKHSFADCLYINIEKRPKNWSPNADTMKSVEERIQNSRYGLRAVLRRIQKDLPENPPSSSPQSLQPANAAIFTSHSQNDEDNVSVVLCAVAPLTLNPAALSASTQSVLQSAVIVDTGSHIHIGRIMRLVVNAPPASETEYVSAGFKPTGKANLEMRASAFEEHNRTLVATMEAMQIQKGEDEEAKKQLRRLNLQNIVMIRKYRLAFDRLSAKNGWNLDELTEAQPNK